MRSISTILVVATTVMAVVWSSVSEASFFGLPRALRRHFSQLVLSVPVLPPFGHTRFCLRYPDECRVHGVDFRRRTIALTPARWAELNAVNRRVNRDIVPQIASGNGTFDDWTIAPTTGDCKHYAITKRHELLARGWPSRSLLLSEVVIPSGEHHLLLVVRTKDTDLVLDNLTVVIRAVAATYRQYRWVRVETPQNPKFWARVQTPSITATLAQSTF
jgi:predicted transglutaminase-like cysteine proteinase